VGSVVSDKLGFGVGRSLGSGVGGSLGCKVGCDVGPGVGDLAGDLVGELVGDLVGELVGLPAGCRVGPGLGAAVGILMLILKLSSSPRKKRFHNFTSSSKVFAKVGRIPIKRTRTKRAWKPIVNVIATSLTTEHFAGHGEFSGYR
jgi:hypothetical protein